jgi:molybdate transport system substrate-binding protein
MSCIVRLFCLIALVLPLGARAAPAGLTVFAAASLTDAFNDIGTLWRAKGHQITFVYASSATLAAQIGHGAPADVFASADELWMDRLENEKRINPATRFDLVGNTLVLVERRDGLQKVKLGLNTDLAGLLGPGGRLAVGDTRHVPAGIYAKQALQRLNLWDSVKSRLAPAENVRAALLLVERGETRAGIVYGTDVRVAPSLAVAGTFPPGSHDPIIYPVAATTHAAPETDAFLAFLRSEAAQDVLVHYDFPKP